MRHGIDRTHDPALRSWVASANDAHTDFPIQNLPIGQFRRLRTDEDFRSGIAIGNAILDLRAPLLRTEYGPAREVLEACGETGLNRLMGMGTTASRMLRELVSDALREGSAHAERLAGDLILQADAEFALPARIGDFTDFYASIHHATAVGRKFRPGNPLLPNYQWLPVAYHGRSSSITVSGHSFPRPRGQRLPEGSQYPVLEPTQRLDFELELGIHIGAGNSPGTPVLLKNAEAHVFGLSVLNDWSARDIQSWEYQPLGPFLAKNFATTLSPWIVTLDALTPFRAPLARPVSDPPLLGYLDDPGNRESGAFDIVLEVFLESQTMRERGQPPRRLATSNFKHAYWTVGQMIAHHSINGCNLASGDLLGSGTLSGPAACEAGSMLELTDGGNVPIELSPSETRGFLADGDRVIMRAHCERPGFVSIGFGEAAATVLPARG